MDFPKILLDKISYYLIDRNEKISVAESVTSGFLQLAFSQMPDAEKFFSGGMTTYTMEEKIKHLNIDPGEAKETNCVSKNITETMALNIAKIFGTDWALATTGYATPVAESGYEIFAYYCVAYHNEIMLSECVDLHPLTKPLDAQNYFMECMLSNLRCQVTKNLSQTSIKN